MGIRQKSLFLQQILNYSCSWLKRYQTQKNSEKPQSELTTVLITKSHCSCFFTFHFSYFLVAENFPVHESKLNYKLMKWIVKV